MSNRGPRDLGSDQEKFKAKPSPVLDALRKLDLNGFTPIEALNKLCLVTPRLNSSNVAQEEHF